MELQRHPSSPPSPVERIQVQAAHLADGRLSLVFNISGDIGRLRLPPAGEPRRADGLWRHTCFEAFVRPPRGRSYFELNLAPSGDWAAYRFDHYRSGMTAADVPPPIVRSLRAGSNLGLAAGIELGALPELAPRQAWQVGLAAVIEADDGTLSHWALAHPPGEPDFHDPDCFVLDLPPAV